MGKQSLRSDRARKINLYLPDSCSLASMIERRAFEPGEAESYDFFGALNLSCTMWLMRVSIVARNMTGFLRLRRPYLSALSYDFLDNVEMMSF